MVAIPPSLLGSLAAYPSTHLTPHIGTEFTSPNTQLSALLAAPNSDELIRDLAVLISHRGVVFFKNQRGEALRECVDQKIAATADEKAVPAVAEEKEEEVLKIAGF